MATIHPQQPLPPKYSDITKDVHLNAPRQSSYSVLSPTQPQSTKTDPFYGYEAIAQLSARFITHVFTCPPPAPTRTRRGLPVVDLPHFIAYALHRTKLHQAVTYAALVLLQRLKARFPTAHGALGHHLFISAFMVASKVICDDNYSNKSWTIIAQCLFTLREINQMEREMCNYLDWELTVDNPILSNFEGMVNHDFAPNAKGPYPTYSLHMVSKRVAKAAASASATPIPEPDFTTSHILAFDQQRRITRTKACPAPLPPITPPPLYKKSTSPMTPDTAPQRYSNTIFPASSIAPPTPTGAVDLTARIHDCGKSNYGMSPGLALSSELPQVHPLKGKMFAVAIPAVW
ncbi:hypothetical protein C8R47DRAFT_1248872 [Mycena vitilis]|nr:hypothetical protein C8R47DRAFT_1248872 [Mycena vitilis]